ncbi:MAG: hypothetical protein CVU87_02160 [Firmicutes bacterium HGW-Firmicutes-12]|jgi:hypothetical protein|nr:MAG: hypothetical protein CVU87_02160 [Firmicutes bacterium HGW-Firmicutes-12]
MKLHSKKFIGIFVVGGLLLTAGTITYASNVSTNSSSNPNSVGGHFKQGCPEGMGGPGGGDRHTSREKDKMVNAQEGIQNLTESLVLANIITNDTAEKMITFQEDKTTARQAEMAKLKNMTDAERKAYFESQKDIKPSVRPNLLEDMVTAEILTQDQADVIEKYTANQVQAKKNEQLKEQLDTLVNDSTITEEQEDKIITYLKTQKESRQAEMASLKDMTDAERKAYFESQKDIKPSARSKSLEDLVTAGILTQDQADAVSKSLHPQHPQS